MQRLEVSCAVRSLYRSLGVKGLRSTKRTNCIYRVFHDLWILLQEVISYVFAIKKVHINMCPILDGYGVMTV